MSSNLKAICEAHLKDRSDLTVAAGSRPGRPDCSGSDVSQVAAWRHVMGGLSHTNALLTSSGEPSRLKVILSTGLMTPTGVVTEGSHDASRAYYVYETDKAGDGMVEEARVLDDVEATSPIVERFHGVPHGRLMIDPQLLSYFTRELSDQPMMSNLGRVSVKSGPEP